MSVDVSFFLFLLRRGIVSVFFSILCHDTLFFGLVCKVVVEV